MKKLKPYSPLPVLFFTVFIDLLGVGILVPVIPQLLGNPTSPLYLLPEYIPIETGYILLGMLVGIYPFGQFLAAPILGQLSDRFGRKKILAVSLFGTCISYAVFAYAILIQSVMLLFIARFFDGITGGNLSVAQAAVADVTKPEDRAKNFGMIGAAFGLGFVLGPYLGAKLADATVIPWFDASTPFWFAALLTGIDIVWLLLFFSETRHERRTQICIEWGKSFRNIFYALDNITLRPLFLTAFLFQGGFSFYIYFLTVFLIDNFGFTQVNIGNYFAYVGLWFAFAQLIVTRFLSKKFREDQILHFTIFCTSIWLLMLFFANTRSDILLIAPFLAICTGVSFANIAALISRSVSSSVQGEVLGISMSVHALAQSIPPILSGFIAAFLAPESPILIASIIVITSGIVFVSLYQRPVHAINPNV